MYKRIVILAALMAIVIRADVYSAVPNFLNLQGRLTDTSGNPIKVPTQVDLYLYRGGSATKADDGTVVYKERVIINPASDGTYQHLLGSGTPLEGYTLTVSAFDSDQDIYLQMIIAGVALLPRLKLVSDSFSFVSERSHVAHVAESVLPGVIGLESVKPGALTSDAIAPESLLPTTIKSKSLSTDQMKPGGLLPESIAPKSITSDLIKPGSITNESLQGGAVSSGTIQPGVITPDLIKPFSLTPDQIQPGSLTTATLQDNAVTAAKLGSGAVTTDKILDGTIQTVDLEDGLVTLPKLDGGVSGKLVPSSMVAMFTGGCPAGWTRFSLLDNRFPLGVSSYTGTPSGSASITGLTTSPDGSHTHTIPPHHHGVNLLAAATPNACGKGMASGGSGCYPPVSDHTHIVSGDTDDTSLTSESAGQHTHTINSDGSWLPPYLGLVFCRKD